MLIVSVRHEEFIDLRSYLNVDDLAKVITYANHDKTNIAKGYPPDEHYAGLLGSQLTEMGFEVEVRTAKSECQD